MNLFNTGNFTLHSGQETYWKVDCDALTDEDVETLAAIIARRVGYPFGEVSGVPRGGLRLASALEKYCTPNCRGYVLIVDDVYTTGASLKAHSRNFPEAIAIQYFVAFARIRPPANVQAVWVFSA